MEWDLIVGDKLILVKQCEAGGVEIRDKNKTITYILFAESNISGKLSL